MTAKPRRLWVLAWCLLLPLTRIVSAGEPMVIFPGNWGDITILKDGDDYYATHSGGTWVPAYLIWHSRDLRSWTPLGHAVRKSLGASLWAPDLAKHGNTYYLYFTRYVAGDARNFVVTAQTPAGPWSEPVEVGVGRIDPGHVVDDEGRRFLYLSAGQMVPLSDDGLHATAAARTVYDPWPIPDSWAIECGCHESPKLSRRGDWYYLTTALGGTAGPSTSHMAVVARSKSAEGPWEYDSRGPLLRTRDRSEPWWSQGHATLVEGPDGKTYAAYHAIANGLPTLGRQNLLAPIDWSDDGWPRVSSRPLDREPVPKLHLPLTDEFDSSEWGLQWQTSGDVTEGRIRTTDGQLVMRAQGTTPGDCQPLLALPHDERYVAELEFERPAAGEAGLVLWASPKRNVAVGVGSDGRVRQYDDGARSTERQPAPEPGGATIRVRIYNNRQDVTMLVHDGRRWQPLRDSKEVSSYGRLRMGIYACGGGEIRCQRFVYHADVPNLAAAASDRLEATTAIADLCVHDPCILADRASQTYYIYRSYSPGHWGDTMDAPAEHAGVQAFWSHDLATWYGPTSVFEIPDNFWADCDANPWAPEVHAYQGRYYLCTTFNAWKEQLDERPGRPFINRRASQVLVADSPLGPFVPFANQPHTPPGEMTLDATLWVEDGTPYLVYCHEWVQLGDGLIKACAMQPDLSACVGDSFTLLDAGQVPWTKKTINYKEQPYPGAVTDGPWLQHNSRGQLLLFWSSWHESRQYAEALAISDSGKLAGPWRHVAEPLLLDDRGHGATFRAFDGRWLLGVHRYFHQPKTRVQIWELSETPDGVAVGQQLWGAP